MKVSQTIAVSVGRVLFLGLMALSTGLALAEHGDEGGGVRLKAKMVSDAASGNAYYQELGYGRRLNLGQQIFLAPRSL